LPTFLNQQVARCGLLSICPSMTGQQHPVFPGFFVHLRRGEVIFDSSVGPPVVRRVRCRRTTAYFFLECYRSKHKTCLCLCQSLALKSSSVSWFFSVIRLARHAASIFGIDAKWTLVSYCHQSAPACYLTICSVRRHSMSGNKKQRKFCYCPAPMFTL